MHSHPTSNGDDDDDDDDDDEDDEDEGDVQQPALLAIQQQEREQQQARFALQWQQQEARHAEELAAGTLRRSDFGYLLERELNEEEEGDGDSPFCPVLRRLQFTAAIRRNSRHRGAGAPG